MTLTLERQSANFMSSTTEVLHSDSSFSGCNHLKYKPYVPSISAYIDFVSVSTFQTKGTKMSISINLVK